MYFLAKFIQEGRTVVYESILSNCYWVFSSKNSRLCPGRVSQATCPEVNFTDTVFIFDTKAGSREEASECAAITLFLSSTNLNNYKQSERMNYIKYTFPSTTPAEFEEYRVLLKVSEIKADDVIKVCGSGKVRNLLGDHKIEETKSNLARFNFDDLQLYASAYNVYENAKENPANLLDCDVSKSVITNGVSDEIIEPEVEINNTNKPDLNQLSKRYLFYNATWRFCSPYILNEILEKYKDKVHSVVLAFCNSIGQSKTASYFSNSMGQILEPYAADYIMQFGLTCFSVKDKSVLSISGNLHRKHFNVQTKNAIVDCTDDNTLSTFAKGQPLFDSFIKPNYFLNVTTSVTDQPRHKMLYSELAKYSHALAEKKLDLNFIFVVPHRELDKWKDFGRFPVQIDDNNVVNFINSKTKKQKLKLNGERAFSSLPSALQFSNLKVFVAGFDISKLQKRSYGTVRALPKEVIKHSQKVVHMLMKGLKYI